VDQVHRVEQQLDKGQITLSDDLLKITKTYTPPEETEPESKTPYTDDLEQTRAFYNDMKNSDYVLTGMKKLTDDMANGKYLKEYMEIMGPQGAKELDNELNLTAQLNLIELKKREVARGAAKFVAGEDAYARLVRAKELDKLNRQFLNIQIEPFVDDSGSSTSVKLNPEMYDYYMKEIMENGGAPSLSEIVSTANKVKLRETPSLLMRMASWAYKKSSALVALGSLPKNFDDFGESMSTVTS